MGNFKKHFELAKEKFKATITAYHNKQSTVVGDLGYDGINGKRAKAVIDNLKIIIQFCEKRFEVKIYEENT